MVTLKRSRPAMSYAMLGRTHRRVPLNLFRMIRKSYDNQAIYEKMLTSFSFSVFVKEIGEK